MLDARFQVRLVAPNRIDIDQRAGEIEMAEKAPLKTFEGRCEQRRPTGGDDGDFNARHLRGLSR